MYITSIVDKKDFISVVFCFVFLKKKNLACMMVCKYICNIDNIKYQNILFVVCVFTYNTKLTVGFDLLDANTWPILFPGFIFQYSYKYLELTRDLHFKNNDDWMYKMILSLHIKLASHIILIVLLFCSTDESIEN